MLNALKKTKKGNVYDYMCMLIRRYVNLYNLKII